MSLQEENICIKPGVRFNPGFPSKLISFVFYILLMIAKHWKGVLFLSNREPTLYIHFYSNKKGNPEVRSIEFLMANRKKKKLSLEKSRMVSLEESEDSTYRYEYTVAFYPAGDTIWWYVGEKLAQLPENQRKNRETDVVEFVQDLLKLTEISIVDIDTDEKYMDVSVRSMDIIDGEKSYFLNMY